MSFLPSEQTKIILWRGVCERCPKCGQGRIFQSYLKQNESCTVCGENLARFRADDGPAWLTILIVGHVVVPTAIYFSMHDVLPDGIAISLLFALTISVALLVLPRAKGVFISVLWLLAQKKAAKAV